MDSWHWTDQGEITRVGYTTAVFTITETDPRSRTKRSSSEITRVGYTTAVFTITGRETDPRWPEDQEILREKTPVYLGLKDSLSQADGTSVLDVERSYAYVVADLNLNVVKPARDMPIDGQRFVVELY